MKKLMRVFPLLLFFLMLLTGCEAIGDIFKAGVWVGILVVVAVIGLIIFIVSKAGSKD